MKLKNYFDGCAHVFSTKCAENSVTDVNVYEQTRNKTCENERGEVAPLVKELQAGLRLHLTQVLHSNICNQWGSRFYCPINLCQNSLCGAGIVILSVPACCAFVSTLPGLRGVKPKESKNLTGTNYRASLVISCSTIMNCLQGSVAQRATGGIGDKEREQATVLLPPNHAQGVCVCMCWGVGCFDLRSQPSPWRATMRWECLWRLRCTLVLIKRKYALPSRAFLFICTGYVVRWQQ